MRRVQAVPSLLLLLVLQFSACSGKPEGADYFWNGSGPEVKHYAMRTLIPGTGIVDGTMIQRTGATAMIDGRTYHKTVTAFDGIPGAQGSTSYARLASDGIYSRTSTDPKAPEVLDTPLPPVLGRKWSVAQGALTLDLEISTIEDFDTAEKTYKDCMKVTGSGTNAGVPVKFVSYYARNLGLVKMSMEGEGVLLELNLRSQ